MADFFEQFGGRADESEPQRDFFAQFGGQPESASGPSAVESGLRGAAQGATLGYGDEAVGAGSAYLEPLRQLDPAGYLTPLIGEASPSGDLGEVYSEARDAEREANREAREANPEAYLGGELAGGVASAALVPSSTLARGAGLAARVGQAAKAGAATGAAAGAGYSEAEDALGVGSDALLGAATGAATGAALPVAGEAARRAGGAIREGAKVVTDSAREAVPALRSFADRQYYRQISGPRGGQGRTAIKKFSGPDAPFENATAASRWAKQEGLIQSSTDGPRQVLDRARALNEKAGKGIGEMRELFKDLGYGPSSPWVRGQLERLAKESRSFSNPASRRITTTVDQIKDDVFRNTDEAGRVPPEVLDKLKRDLDTQIADFFPQGPPGDIARLRTDMRRIFNEAEETVSEQLGPDFNVDGVSASETFKKLKEQYGRTSDLVEVGEYALTGELGNKSLSLTDWLSAAVSPAILLAKKASERFGPGSSAEIAEKAAARFERLPADPTDLLPDLPSLPAEARAMLDSVRQKAPQEAALLAAILRDQYGDGDQSRASQR